VRGRWKNEDVPETEVASQERPTVGHRESEDFAVRATPQADVADVACVETCRSQISRQGPGQILVDEKAWHLSNRADLLGFEDRGRVAEGGADILGFDTVFLGDLVDGHS
jgi:hypothetical protein